MRVPIRATAVPVVASAFAMTIGTLVLTGWIFDLSFLKSAGAPITMKANMAIAVIAAALALLSATPSLSMPLFMRRLGMCAALFAAGIGVLTLSEHLFAANFGV